MQRWILMGVLALGGAQAATLEVSGGFGFRAEQDAVPLLGARVSGLEFVPEHSLSLGLSSRALEATLERTINGGPLGFGQAVLGADLTYSGGLNLRSSLNGTLGPVALGARLDYWNTPKGFLDPFSVLGLEPESRAPESFKAELSGRYRLERNTFLNARARLGVDSLLELGLTRQVEGLELRGGLSLNEVWARGGTYVYGLRGGVSTKSDENRIFALDGLLGLNGSGGLEYGLRGSATLYGVLPLNSDLNLYAALEPWRGEAAGLRYGLTTATSLENGGTLNLEVGADREALNVRVRYALELGGSGAEE